VNGKLIVFESIDGGGKGTQLAKTLLWLQQKIGGENVVTTKEP
jgi:dTMP kinase